VKILELFKRSIKNGTGEAIILLMENPEVNFDQLILQACTHNLAYDPQCEGSRAHYLFEILSLAQNTWVLINKIINRLNFPSTEYWDAKLLFDLLGIIAKEGSELARQALYQRYSNNLKNKYEFIDTNVLITLDGLKGLEFVADIQGKQLKLDPDDWVDDYPIQLCKKHFPNTDPENYLKEKSKTNHNIKEFLIKIKATNLFIKKDNIPFSLQQLLNLIDLGKDVFSFMGKDLTEKNVLKLAQLLLNEKNSKKIQSYLSLLIRHKYPLDISNLLRLLEIEEQRVKNLTLRLLSKIKDKKIRTLIDLNYTNLTYLYNHLAFFVSNYLENDITVLSNILNTLETEEDIHSFGLIILDIFDQNMIENPKKLLYKLYYLNNCSICRESFIRKLMLANQISDKLLQELKYDCDNDIRQLANQYKQD